ncbi:MAG TPA: D-alanine--D-alanine ligase [Prolixibacteraceae bacterium]|nr:D-alanine--D-alanine ligase [Prolixibacteraceae bacterium]
MQKKNIAVICGGNSSEYEVSIKSGKNIFGSIDTRRFTPWLVRIRFDEWVVLEEEKILAEIDRADFSFRIHDERIRPDFAFIMIHGTPGEDGILQGYFDLVGIPCSTPGVYTSALTFHKFFCDNFLRSFGIKMARSFYFRRGDLVNPEDLVRELGFPMFIKPSAGGSSFGVTKVKNTGQIIPAMEAAFAESNDCLVEECIEGMELAVGACAMKGKIVPFLPTEVIPKGEFFDYHSKYSIGGATEITPARLPEKKIRECQELTAYLYRLTGCKGIVRIDYILKGDSFYFLEINTVPGMTHTSFIPQQLKAMGLDMKEVLTGVIENGIVING